MELLNLSVTQFTVLKLKRSLSGALASCGCTPDLLSSAEPQLGKLAHGTALRTARGTAREVARGIARGTADRTVDGTAFGISHTNAWEISRGTAHLPPLLELEVAVPLKSRVHSSF